MDDKLNNYSKLRVNPDLSLLLLFLSFLRVGLEN